MRFILALAAGLAPGLVFAADAAPDVEIVVTAPLSSPPGELLQGVTILERTAITAGPTGGLGGVLDAVPGVASTGFSAGASRPIIRGLGEDRIRILTNGLGQIDASSVSPDHAVATDSFDAERIEVLRGAAAVAYGGNAAAGVVNVIDGRIIERQPEKALGGEAVIAGDTGSSLFEAAGSIVFAGANAAVRLDGFTREADDYEIPGFALSADERAEEIAEALEEGEPAPEFARDVAPSSFTEADSIGVSASTYGDWGFAAAAVRRFTTLYGIPEAHAHGGEEEEEEEAIFDGPRIDLEATRYELHGGLNAQVGVFNGLRARLAVVDYEHAEIEPSGEVGTVFTNEGFEARIEAPHRRGPVQGNLGLSGFSTDFAAVGEEAFVTPTKIDDIGAFIIERVKLGAWTLEGGGRLEQRRYDNDAAGERDFTLVSASIGAGWRPAEPLFLGLTLARSARAPTETELFADGAHLATAAFEIGDPELDEEIALSIDAVARWTLPRASLEATVYHTQFDGFITAFATGTDDAESGLPIFAFRQQDANLTGAEVLGRATIAQGAGWAVRGDAAYDIVLGELDEGGDLPRLPPQSATFGLEGEAAGFLARVETVVAAEQDNIAPFETPTEGYTLLNARLRYAPPAWNERAAFVIDARNLTDEEARLSTSFTKDLLPQPGRSVRFALQTRF
jgi:iron complex outermembrane receptor protein